MRKYDAIDLIRIICSALVIVLHTNPFPEHENFILPITHIAVPFFFVVGSFFLWKKINSVSTQEEKDKIVKDYVKKILCLYFIWFIITLPITLYTRHFFEKGILYGVLYFCRELLLHSTWRSSWYLMATVIGTVLTYFFCEKRNINKKIWVACVLFLYIICAIGSSYSGILYSHSIIWDIYLQYVRIFTVPYTSFPVSLLWIYIGKVLAEKENYIREKYSLKGMSICFVISIGILLVEGYSVYRLDLIKMSDDCYFALVPVTIMLICMAMCININIKCAKKLRKISMLVYCMQGSLVEILGKGLRNCLLIMGICYGISVAVVFAEEWKNKNGIK